MGPYRRSGSQRSWHGGCHLGLGWLASHREPRGGTLNRWPASDSGGDAPRVGDGGDAGPAQRPRQTARDDEPASGHPLATERVSVTPGWWLSSGQCAHRSRCQTPEPLLALGVSGWPPGGSATGQLNRRPAGVLVAKTGSGTRGHPRREACSQSTAVLPPIGLSCGRRRPREGHAREAGPPPLTATQIVRREWRRRRDSSGSGHAPHTGDHVYVKGWLRGWIPLSLRVTGTRPGGDAVPQVGDLVEVLVRGGVVEQFA